MTVSDKGDEMCFSFTILDNCPIQKPIGCSDTNDNMLQGKECLDTQDMSPESQKLITPQKQVNVPNDSVSTSTLLQKRKQSKASIVDTEVRRSEKMKGKHQGYKSNSCPRIDCFCCNIEAPTLSTKVIRNLGKDFYHIPGEELNEEILKKKPLAKKIAGPRAK
jgi:quinolinate synthase